MHNHIIIFREKEENMCICVLYLACLMVKSWLTIEWIMIPHDKTLIWLESKIGRNAQSY